MQLVQPASSRAPAHAHAHPHADLYLPEYDVDDTSTYYPEFDDARMSDDGEDEDYAVTHDDVYEGREKKRRVKREKERDNAKREREAEEKRGRRERRYAELTAQEEARIAQLAAPKPVPVSRPPPTGLKPQKKR